MLLPTTTTTIIILIIISLLVINSSSAQQELKQERNLRYYYDVNNNNNSDNDVTYSTTFPPAKLSLEAAELSFMVYKVHSQDDPLIPSDYEAFYFEDQYDAGKVLLLYSHNSNNPGTVFIVFGGTDGINDIIDDIDILMVPFGPQFDAINKHAWVHQGFNNVLFGKKLWETSNLYDRIVEVLVNKVQGKYPEARVVVTGHSLGAGLAVLMGTALAASNHDEKFSTISFGCPRVGGETFREWANYIPNAGIFRFVFEKDLIARSPGRLQFYHHTGHTLQLEEDGATAYFLHSGNKTLGYAGVPSSWYENAKSMHNHYMPNYINYIGNYSLADPDNYYFNDFARLDLSANVIEMQDNQSEFVSIQ